MLGLRKRPLEPLDPGQSLQRQYFARFGAAPEPSPRQFERSHVFVDENNLKRDYNQFREDHDAQLLIAQQLNQPRTRPSGEIYTPDKDSADPDISMTDAPAVRHVHYTPPAGWGRASRSRPTFPKESILKKRMQPYDNLPYDCDQVHSPFQWDISEYIEETERLDAEQERLERERITAVKLRRRRLQSQAYNPRLDTADFGRQQGASAGRTSTAESHPRKSVLLTRESSPPLRKILTPAPQRSPPQQRPSPPRPTTIELYPELAAQQLPSVQSAVEEATPVRQIGGMVVDLIRRIPQALARAYYAIFGGTPADHQEIVAVETNKSGRKRRAVDRQDLENPTPAQNLQGNLMMDSVPGGFPASGSKEEESIHQMIPAGKQQNTPPISRPGSSESGQNHSPNVETITQNNPSTQTTAQAAAQQPSPPVENAPFGQQKYGSSRWRPDRKELHLTEDEKKFLAQINNIKQQGTVQNAQATEARKEPEPRVPKVKPLPSYARPHVTDRSKLNKERDDGVDSLLERTRRITLEKRKNDDMLRRSRLRHEREAVERLEESQRESIDYKERARKEIEEQTREMRKTAEKEAKEEAERLAAEAAEAAAKEAEKNKLIRDLPPEWAERVDAAMSHAKSNPRKVLAKAADGAELTAYDMGRIIPSNKPGSSTDWWLNDEGVNAVMNAIVAAKKEQTGWKRGSSEAPHIVAYNSAWLNSVKAKGIDSIAGWSRRQGIKGKLFTAQQVFFPINTGAHWLLLVIRPQAREIELLDSAGRGHSSFFKIARDWLHMELGTQYIPDEWRETVGRSQQQMNFDDCGVFTCMNALASAKERDPSEVMPSNGMINARRMIVAVLLNEGFKGDWEL